MSLEIRNLKQGYGSKVVLEDISLEVPEGSVVAILGPNGSGKSTLIKFVCRIKPPMSGSISVDGQDSLAMDRRTFSKYVGYVPQKYAPSDYMQVYDAVLIGRAPYMEWTYSKNDFEMAAKAVEAMGIEDLLDKNVQDLSGGQIQKVTIARAIAQDPKYFVLDEPTSALALKNQMDTLRTMRDITSSGKTGALVALHDINLAMHFADSVVMIKDGLVHSSGTPAEAITERTIEEVYGVQSEIVEGRGGLYVHIYG